MFLSSSKALLWMFFFLPALSLAQSTPTPSLGISNPVPPEALAGQNYSHLFLGQGGTAPYSFALESGILPSGYSFMQAGAIYGYIANTAPASFPIVIRVIDATGKFNFVNVTFHIKPSTPVAKNAHSLPTGQVSRPYEVALDIVGGWPPFTCTINSGNLPPGLGVRSGCVIAGVPTFAGTYSFNLLVMDSGGKGTIHGPKIDIAQSDLRFPGGSLGTGQVGLPFSTQVAATGGRLPYTFSLVNPALFPPGLSLSTAGTVSGTPQASGRYDFSIRVTDGAGESLISDWTLTISGRMEVALSGFRATVGQPYSYTFLVQGGAPPYRLSIQSGSLPPGIRNSGLTLDGTPTNIGTYSVGFLFEDSAQPKNSVLRLVEFIVDPRQDASLRWLTTAVSGATLGQPYQADLVAIGGSSIAQFRIINGSLPPGLSLTSSGRISGTPSSPGNFNFVVEAYDSAGAKVPSSFSIAVAGGAITISPPQIPAYYQGPAYQQQLSANGGTAPYTFSLESGSTLPFGFQLSASGLLSGGVLGAAPASHTFTVSVIDATQRKATQAYTLEIRGLALRFEMQQYIGAHVGIPYSLQFNATGGTLPYRYAASASIPSWLSINGDKLQGTPPLRGTYNFSVTVTDAVAQSQTQFFSLNVDFPPGPISTLRIATQVLPNGRSGVPYSASIQVENARADLRLSLVGGELPAGLSLNGQTISGTPTRADGASFTIQARDSQSTDQKSYMVTIAEPLGNRPPISVGPNELPPLTIGQDWFVNFAAQNGAYPFQWVISGNLPDGILDIANGSLGGRPLRPGTFTFTVTVRDHYDGVASRTYTVTVPPSQQPLAPAISTSSLPQAQVGVNYQFGLTASGGAPPYTFSTPGIGLPPGLSMDATGLIRGIPTSTGTFRMRFLLRDSAQTASERDLEIVVIPSAAPNRLRIVTDSLPTATIGASYSASISAANGAPPYTFAATGAIPQGLSLDNSGLLRGAPATSGAFRITIQVTDSTQAKAQRDLDLIIIPAVSSTPLSILTNVLPNGTIGASYSANLSVANGAPPYRFEITRGSLPSGLALAAIASQATISGTPSAAGTFTFDLRVSDAAGATALKTLALEVLRPPLVFSTSSLRSARALETYSERLQVSGGLSPHRFSLLRGSVPGLQLSSGGVLEGTPTQAGNFTLTIQVNDAANSELVRDFSLLVQAPAPLLLQTALAPAGNSYVPYELPLQVSGATLPLSFAIESGALPPGLSLNPQSGLISGAPLLSGTFNAVLTARDSRQQSASKSFTFLIQPAQSLPDLRVGAAVTLDLPFGTGPAPRNFFWNAPPGYTLPVGLNLSPSGRLSGTPQSSGLYPFAVNVQDGSGVFHAVSYLLHVLPQSEMALETYSAAPATVDRDYRAALAGRASDYRLVSGQFPPGLRLNADGSITGRPTREGTYSVLLAAIDQNSQSVQGRLELRVLPASATASKSPEILGLRQAASFEEGGLAPGSLFVLFGRNLGPEVLQSIPASSQELPRSLASIRVLCNGIAAPLLYVSAGQIAAILPFALESASALEVVIDNAGLKSHPWNLPLLKSKLGLFTFDSSGSGTVAALNQDGSAHRESGGARPGEVIVLFGTGGGAMTPAGRDGQIAQGISSLISSLQASVGGIAAEILYAGNAPGLAEGVLQFNIRLPNAVPKGMQRLRIEQVGRTLAQDLVVWVE